MSLVYYKAFDFEHMVSGLWLNSSIFVATIFVSVVTRNFKYVQNDKPVFYHAKYAFSLLSHTCNINLLMLAANSS